MYVSLESGEYGLRCCTADHKDVLPESERYNGCYPIKVPVNDTLYKTYGIGCMDYIRSQPLFANDGSIGTTQMVCLTEIGRIFYVNIGHYKTNYLHNSCLPGLVRDTSSRSLHHLWFYGRRSQFRSRSYDTLQKP